MNGYESKDHWNTALWINNDQSFYNLMINETEKAVYLQQSLAGAVVNILNTLPEKTPDGFDWQMTTVADLVAENYNEMLEHS
jgi:hypothetical protein